MTVARLVSEAAALGVRLEARPGGRLWADRPGLLPTALRDSLAAHRPAVVALLAEQAAPLSTPRAGGSVMASDAPPPAPVLPDVPLDWCEGVALLAARPAPDTIHPRRWAVLATTSAWLLREHGAALHGARWDTIALFGLHPTAPMTYPPGWGVAWLLGEHGAVLDVAPDAVGMRRAPDGARLAYRRPGALARASLATAWLL